MKTLNLKKFQTHWSEFSYSKPAPTESNLKITNPNFVTRPRIMTSSYYFHLTGTHA